MKPYVKNFWKAVVPQAVWKRLFRTSSQLIPEQFLARQGVLSMFWSLENLKKLGYNPASVIDAGAFNGAWTLRASGIFDQSNFLMIEAQPEKESRLESISKNNPGIDHEITLLSSESGQDLPFHSMKTGSSVFRQLHQGKNKGEEITLKSKSLDDIVSEHQLSGDYFLKMDLQGYELEVLKGATQVLSNTSVVLMEASLLNFNQGAPLIDEVVAFMKSRSFILFDICELHRKSEDNVLNQVDLIFCKEDWKLREKANFI